MKHRTRFFLCSLVSLLSISATTHGYAQEIVSKPVSVNQTVQDDQIIINTLKTVYQFHPTLAAARARFQSDYERIIQAYGGIRPNVDLNANIQNIEIDGNFFGPRTTATTEKNLGAQLRQPLFRGLSTYADIQSAQSFVMGQFYQLQDIEQGILEQSLRQIFELVTARYLIEANQQNLTLLEEQVRNTNARFDVGEITRTDTAQAQAALEDSRANLQNAISQQEIAQAAMKQIIGDDAQAKLLLPALQKLDLGLLKGFILPLPEGLESLKQAAHTQQPLILSAKALAEAAKYDTKQVAGTLLPRLDLVAGWNRVIDPAPGLVDRTTNKVVGLTATMPLYDAGNTYSRIRQAKAQSQARNYDFQDIQRKVDQNVETSWSLWQAARAQLKSRQAQLDASVIARDAIQEEQKNGLRSTLDVLQVNQAALDAKTAHLTARRDELVAFYTLMRQAGMLTQGQLSPLNTQQKDYEWLKINQILGVRF